MKMGGTGLEAPSGARELSQSGDPITRPTATVSTEAANLPPDLARIVTAWPTLGEPARRAVLEIVEQSGVEEPTANRSQWPIPEPAPEPDAAGETP